MPDSISIFKKETCFICKGTRLVVITFKFGNRKFNVTSLCFHCLGKGFLKLFKSDYDY